MRKMDSSHLIIAARQGRASFCSDLLEHGANVHDAGGDGWCALHGAAWSSHADVCQILLEHGANVDVTNNNGESALHLAAALGRSNACIVLLGGDADFQMKNHKGETALEVALKNKHDDCVTVIQTWLSAHAARAALREIACPGAVKVSWL